MSRSRSIPKALAGTVVAVLLLMATPMSAATADAVDPGNALAASVIAAGSASPTGTATSSASGSSGVQMELISTSPIAPPVAPTDTTVTVTVTITNNTDSPLTSLQIRGVRDSPIVRSSVLDNMLAHPQQPSDDSLTQPMPTTRYAAAVPAHSSAQFDYSFLASSIRESGGACLCQAGIYPIDLSAFAATGGSNNSSSTQLAWVQTYIVSATSAPASQQVSWLWPLIDRPHRLGDGLPFFDDDLATSVADGGRLDRALRTLEQLTAGSQVTVVIDPELIDELVQMSTGYRVQVGGGTVAGTGSAAAAAWLGRLRTVLATLPFTLTPYGDPAVNAVAAAHLTWPSRLTEGVQARVTAALGRAPTPADATLAWPPTGSLTPAALTDLAADGTSAVVLNDTGVSVTKQTSPSGPALASIAVPGTTATTVRALVTSSALEQRVSGLLANGSAPLAQLPALLAELALPALATHPSPTGVVLTPDRYVDATPATAAAVINATTQQSWSTPTAAATAALTTASTAAIPRTNLIAPQAANFGGSATLIAAATNATAFVAEFSSAVDPIDQSALLAGFPAAIQLCQSAAWGADAAAATAFASMLTGLQTALTGQVQIVPPANGSYSLASSSAPILITVANNLSVPVSVRLTMSSADGVAGFRVDDAGVQTIPADSRRTIKVQAHVSRSGHLRVQAQLLMPAGAAYGAPLPLTIYSSALGTIGVIITVAAAGILLLALIYRFARRWRHHRELIRRVMDEQQQVLAGTRG